MTDPADALRALAAIEALHRPIDAVLPCEHAREGEHCGIDVDGVWQPSPTCGGGDRHGSGVLRVKGCSECMVGSYGCDMPEGLDAWDATVLVEATEWCHVPWPCPTAQHVRAAAPTTESPGSEWFGPLLACPEPGRDGFWSYQECPRGVTGMAAHRRLGLVHRLRAGDRRHACEDVIHPAVSTSHHRSVAVEDTTADLAPTEAGEGR